MVKAILFDLDGTLVDSNDKHVDAWAQVFADAGHPQPRDKLRGQIGKGADNYVPAILPGTTKDECERLGEAHGRVFKARFLDTVRPFAGAHDLLARAAGEGIAVVLASSASQEDLDHYVDLLDARDLITATTSIDDVERSKPDPDIFGAAVAKLDGIAPADALVVGDSIFDMEAAGRCGVPAVAVRSGGFDDGALREAGARAIYDDAAQILARFDRAVLQQKDPA